MKISSIVPAEQGVDAETAETIFDHVAQFASYGFNLSHATAYASITFQTASLRAHHPEAFFAASMNMAMDTVEDLAIFANALKNRDIPLIMPDINLSKERFFSVSQETGVAIVYALAALRGVGAACAKDIVAERGAGGPYTSLSNLRDRLGSRVNKKALGALVGSGALDGIIKDRATALHALTEKANNPNQFSLFADEAAAFHDAVAPLDAEARMNASFDAFGYWLGEHPLSSKIPLIKAKGLMSRRALDAMDPLPKVAWLVGGVLEASVRGTKSGGSMGIVCISDSLDTYEVVAFDDAWSNVGAVCKKGHLVALEIVPIREDSVLRLMVKTAQPLDEKTQRVFKKAS